MKKTKNSPRPDLPEDAANAPAPDAAANAPELAVPENDTVKQLQDALAELQTKYVYLQAEYQNFRKRAAKDAADARSYAVIDTLLPFLTLGDYLKMAEQAAEKSDNVESIRQGLKMIIAEFFKAFDEIGVRSYDSVGKAFDPQLHDAVSNEASETVPEGTVIREWAAGFKLGDKILRPAKVVVSSGKPAEPAADEKTE